MIAQLQGQCVHVEKGQIVISAGGVGFGVLVPETLAERVSVGEEHLLYTQLIVRDNEMYLVGFASTAERDIFRLLVNVSGVGPKLALKILSVMTPNAFMISVASNDAKALTKIPGVGNKTAKRLLLEMSGKFADKVKEELPLENEQSPGDLWTAAQEVLLSFGCSADEASAALKAVGQEGLAPTDDVSVDSIVMAAFKVLGQH